jgi:hypothetical protein
LWTRLTSEQHRIAGIMAPPRFARLLKVPFPLSSLPRPPPPFFPF